MTLRAALARARRIANRTGHRVFVVLGARGPRLTQRNPWITSRGHRMELDDAGRIVRGGARGLVGVGVRSTPDYWRERREIEAPGFCYAGGRVPAARHYYVNTTEAYRALLDANPRLDAFLESVGGAGAYGKAARRTPAGFAGEGGIDVIRQYLERSPKQIRTFAQAIRALIPKATRGGSGSWADLEDRLPVLQAALDSNIGWPHGARINTPEPAAAASAAEQAREDALDCEAAKPELVERIGDKYRKAIAATEAPF